MEALEQRQDGAGQHIPDGCFIIPTPQFTCATVKQQIHERAAAEQQGETDNIPAEGERPRLLKSAAALCLDVS